MNEDDGINVTTRRKPIGPEEGRKDTPDVQLEN